MPRIICPCCQSALGTNTNGVVAFNQMKSLSMIEIDLNNRKIELKCHSCHNWLLWLDNVLSINHKRKGADLLHSYDKR